MAIGEVDGWESRFLKKLEKFLRSSWFFYCKAEKELSRGFDDELVSELFFEARLLLVPFGVACTLPSVDFFCPPVNFSGVAVKLK